MASKFTVESKKTDLLWFYPEDMFVDPAKRGRSRIPTEDKIQEIEESINEVGQIHPVPVRRITGGVELLAGFTRREAFLRLNAKNPSSKKMMKCYMFTGNEEDAFRMNIDENRKNNITSVIDDAGNVRRWERDFGKTDAEICMIYADIKNGVKVPKPAIWLSNLRKLLTLSYEQQQQIHDGQLAASVGCMLADMAPKEREVVLAEAKAEGGGKVNGSAVLRIAREKKSFGDRAVSLRLPELKRTWDWQAENDPNPLVREMAKINLQYTRGEITEPDYFGAIRALFANQPFGLKKVLEHNEQPVMQ